MAKVRNSRGTVAGRLRDNYFSFFIFFFAQNLGGQIRGNSASSKNFARSLFLNKEKKLVQLKFINPPAHHITFVGRKEPFFFNLNFYIKIYKFIKKRSFQRAKPLP